ncbi:unnamed protein product [Chrysoparadoxa australica]
MKGVLCATLVCSAVAYCPPPPPLGSQARNTQRGGMVMQMQTRERERAATRRGEPSIPRSQGGGSMKEMSSQMKEMRQTMEENEDVKAYMDALRGAALNDADFADPGDMQLIGEDGDSEGLPQVYSPDVLKEYYAKRPQLATKRTIQLAGAFSGFVSSLLWDWATGKLGENEVKRTIQLRETITSLGPFYIKLGQALSIRPDILSPKSMVELQRLCDKVPAFDSKIAFATMEKELARPISEVYSEITPEPLAAASLGQVYKATLRSNGAEVAVKVQRPGVLETVSLDLHLARELGYTLRKLPFLQVRSLHDAGSLRAAQSSLPQDRTDLVALLDEFAYRFYEELDYVKECENGIKIKEDMADIKQIVVPTNYPEWTTRRVFTSEWIDGEKLSQSTASDVGDLVNVGVISYLTQLLDTGFFHADPHPGNLIRTPEGKLALLDFGLMTQVTENQRYGMVEAISHLVHRDYSSIGNDFKSLEFIPEDVDVAPIVPALSNVFDAALAGGGAKSINFQELAGDLAQITFDYPFRLPPYFALIIRAIGTLEGIALVGNPDFAIVDEAYPYISKKLLTDDSPRLRAALRYMVYGKSNVFDVERLIDLLQAFESFSAVKNDTVGPKAPSNLPEEVPGANDVREALRFFFAKEGEFIREFLLDEVVKGVDCVSRDAARELAFTVGLRGPFVPDILKAAAPPLDEDDRKVVDNTRKLLSFLLGDLGRRRQQAASTPYSPQTGLFGLEVNVSPFASGRVTQSSSVLQDELAPVLREVGPEMRAFGLQIVGRLTEKLASRVLRFGSDRVLNGYYARREVEGSSQGEDNRRRRASERRPPPVLRPSSAYFD